LSLCPGASHGKFGMSLIDRDPLDPRQAGKAAITAVNEQGGTSSNTCTKAKGAASQMGNLLRWSVRAFVALLSLQLGTLNAAELAVEYSFRAKDPYGVPQRIAIDKNGAIYGVLNRTRVIRLSSPAAGRTAWVQTELHADPRGINPGLMVGPDGSIYGTTPGQSASDNGSVFMLSPPGPGNTAWIKTELYRFRGGSDGAHPFAVLLLRGRSLYGMTSTSGTVGCRDCKPGVAFRLVRSLKDDKWRFSVIYRFGAYEEMPQNDDPFAIDDAGTLYATSPSGGVGCERGCGTVYQLSPETADRDALWTKKIIHSFKGGTAGFQPSANVVIDRNGILYGSAAYEPSCSPYNYCHAIFKLTRPKTGQPTWAIEYLYRFESAGEGGLYVEAPLVVDGSGAVYGVAGPRGVVNSPCEFDDVNNCGSIFRLDPPASPSERWIKTELYKFNQERGFPTPIVLGPKRTLYGTTLTGGKLGSGTLFKLTQ
jgi:hypothetical protein